MIRKLLAASAFFGALSTSALAADLPNIKGPPIYAPPPPPVFSWTGFYIGVNAGLSGGNFRNQDTAYVTENTEAEADPLVAQLNNYANSSGFSGGGQIGYNWEWPGSNFVAGLETDFQGSTLEGTYFDANLAVPPAGVDIAAEDKTRVDWWGTVRGRIGYAWSSPFGNILPYVTGGFAYGRVANSLNASLTAGGTEDYFSYSNAGTETGWTAGAGVEYAITPNLTLKTEYLYTSLGSLSKSFGPYDIFKDDTLTLTSSTRTNFSTVRAGLNYKFDWFAPGAAPLAQY
jgi:outer membrane immunogenic protein